MRSARNRRIGLAKKKIQDLVPSWELTFRKAWLQMIFQFPKVGYAYIPLNVQAQSNTVRKTQYFQCPATKTNLRFASWWGHICRMKRMIHRNVMQYIVSMVPWTNNASKQELQQNEESNIWKHWSRMSVKQFGCVVFFGIIFFRYFSSHHFGPPSNSKLDNQHLNLLFFLVLKKPPHGAAPPKKAKKAKLFGTKKTHMVQEVRPSKGAEFSSTNPAQLRKPQPADRVEALSP